MAQLMCTKQTWDMLLNDSSLDEPISLSGKKDTKTERKKCYNLIAYIYVSIPVYVHVYM